MWGRMPSEIELAIHGYYVLYDALQEANAGKRTVFWKLFEYKKIPISQESQSAFLGEYSNMKLKKLVDIFVDALKRNDSKKIYEIAAAIDAVRLWNKQLVEKHRAGILLARSYLEKNESRRLTIQQMAKRIQWPQSNTRDGLSQLRRLCRELGYPLASSRQIRTKNRLNVFLDFHKNQTNKESWNDWKSSLVSCAWG